MKQAGIATIFQLSDMIGSSGAMTSAPDDPDDPGCPSGFPARAVPLPFSDGVFARFRAAWEIICGRAYPVLWPKPGELEWAMGRPKCRRSSMPPDTWRRLNHGVYPDKYQMFDSGGSKEAGNVNGHGDVQQANAPDYKPRTDFLP